MKERFKLVAKKQNRPLLTKKRILWLSLIITILWIIWGNTTVQISRIKISDQNIPEEFNGLKIAHISDLHDKNWGDRLVKPIIEEKPDLIAITGDLIDSKNPDIYNAAMLLEQIKEIAPIYFVTGNHEAWSEHYKELEEVLIKHDVIILDNESITVQKNDAKMQLIGVNDPSFHSESNLLNEQSSKLENQLQELISSSDVYNILLSHRPELFDIYVRNEMNLVLTGHAHGGQFRLPFIGGLVAPDQGFFPKYTSGVYSEGNTNMIVSRGLGNSIIPIRVNNRSELLFIELESEE